MMDCGVLVFLSPGGAAVNADFRGRENNQYFCRRKPRFLGDLAISAFGSLIVYSAQNDATGM
jgi:hypothetical protein